MLSARKTKSKIGLDDGIEARPRLQSLSRDAIEWMKGLQLKPKHPGRQI